MCLLMIALVPKVLLLVHVQVWVLLVVVVPLSPLQHSILSLQCLGWPVLMI